MPGVSLDEQIRCVRREIAMRAHVYARRVGQITVKDGIKAVLEVSQIAEQRHLLMDAVGCPVHVIIADATEFTAERAPVPISPDQQSILDAKSGAEGLAL